MRANREQNINKMNQSSRIRATWHSSTSMIFWGVLALTIFGWATAILEPVYAVLNSIFSIASKAQEEIYVTDSLRTFLDIYDNVTTAMRIFEIMTLAGWVIYVIGLIQFKNAQVTRRALRLSGSLNIACWLGLSAIFCGFIAGFLGMFGLLFRFIGWVLMLISLFKFRSTFGKLSWEKSWNKKAQDGAAKAKTSYSLAIILEFFPLICGVVMSLVAFGAISSSYSIAKDFVEHGMGAVDSYLAGSISFVIILMLAGFMLWVCKIVYLFSGWNKVKNGCIRKEILTGQSVDISEVIVEEEDEDSDEEEVLITSVPSSEDAEEKETEKEDSDNKRNWIICGSIASAVILIAILFLCFGGKKDKTMEEVAEPVTEIEFSEESEEKTSPVASEVETSVETYQTSAKAYDIDDEPVGDEYTYNYKGTINHEYAIEMTLITDGGAYYTGEYWYTQNNNPIQLRGQLTDDYEHLVLEEYVGMNMTGKFEGTLTDSGYSGTWTSADGEKSYPFSVSTK